MKQHSKSAKVTLWLNRVIGMLMAILIFCLPVLIDWYCTVRSLSLVERTAILIAFYCSAAVIGIALWQIDRLLTAIIAGDVFIRRNVKRIRYIQLCCGGVSLICLPASFAYLPLIFLVIIMAFLCFMVGVVASVMDAAVTIREENDLTI